MKVDDLSSLENFGLELPIGSTKMTKWSKHLAFYLNWGLGWAWAGHTILRIDFSSNIPFLVSVLVNLGDDPPIGSIKLLLLVLRTMRWRNGHPWAKNYQTKKK